MQVIAVVDHHPGVSQPLSALPAPAVPAARGGAGSVSVPVTTAAGPRRVEGSR